MEVLIVGGGPSVTRGQLDSVAQWRDMDDSRRVMVVNKGVEHLPWADYLFSRDTRFLKFYEEVISSFSGQLVVGNSTITPEGCRVCTVVAYISGAAAIEAAQALGATTIYLIGADGHHKGGAHWFENYERLANAPNYQKFNEYYEDAMRQVSVPVWNLSPGTAITAVPTKDINEVLDGTETDSADKT